METRSVACFFASISFPGIMVDFILAVGGDSGFSGAIQTIAELRSAAIGQ